MNQPPNAPDEIAPNAYVEECPCCGGNVYGCLQCDFETTSSAELDDHECAKDPA